jgi:hypothetical protein
LQYLYYSALRLSFSQWLPVKLLQPGIIALETALDLAILGIGATGAIFENQQMSDVFKEHSAIVGIAVVGINFLLTSFIILIKRYIFHTTNWKLLWSIVSISLGCLALLVTSEVLAYAYRFRPV